MDASYLKRLWPTVACVHKQAGGDDQPDECVETLYLECLRQFAERLGQRLTLVGGAMQLVAHVLAPIGQLLVDVKHNQVDGNVVFAPCRHNHTA